MTTIIILLIICGLPGSMGLCIAPFGKEYIIGRIIVKIMSVLYLLFSLLFTLNYFKLIQIL